MFLSFLLTLFYKHFVLSGGWQSQTEAISSGAVASNIRVESSDEDTAVASNIRIESSEDSISEDSTEIRGDD